MIFVQKQNKILQSHNAYPYISLSLSKQLDKLKINLSGSLKIPKRGKQNKSSAILYTYTLSIFRQTMSTLIRFNQSW
jgi:hypothetical protein